MKGRLVPLSACVLAMLGLVAVVAEEEVESQLGNRGPGFEAGLTPSKLGWGGDDQAYPERFVVNPPDGAEMVWVPGGTFWMGSTQEEIDRLWQENGWDAEWKQFTTNEQPAHEVTLTRGFWLYRHEVTNGQYGRFLAATGHWAPPDWDDYRAHERLPVVDVSWDDASAYAAWASGALPTEAQWEYAARGPEGRLYPWGDQWDRTRCNSSEYWAKRPLNDFAAWQAWFDDDFGGLETSAKVIAHLRDVGSFPSGASWCGALDLSGSLWEWCADWYERDAYKRYAAGDVTPPAHGDMRVVRGGSWYSVDPKSFRCACRISDDPTGRDNSGGFRCSRGL